jgi:hypothetical protein
MSDDDGDPVDRDTPFTGITLLCGTTSRVFRSFYRSKPGLIPPGNDRGTKKRG